MSGLYFEAVLQQLECWCPRLAYADWCDQSKASDPLPDLWVPGGAARIALFMNVILLGYRGCGKTTVGRRLADQLWSTFVDTDARVCQRFNDNSVASIWAQHGEDQWRAMEAEVTAELCQGDTQVIALGGGAVMHPECRQTVEQASHAVRIYLSCQPEELHRRIHADPQTPTMRPSLTDLGGGIDEIRQVLAKRDPVYRSVADRVFDVTHVLLEPAVRHIVEKCL